MFVYTVGGEKAARDLRYLIGDMYGALFCQNRIEEEI